MAAPTVVSKRQAEKTPTPFPHRHRLFNECFGLVVLPTRMWWARRTGMMCEAATYRPSYPTCVALISGALTIAHRPRPLPTHVAVTPALLLLLLLPKRSLLDPLSELDMQELPRGRRDTQAPLTPLPLRLTTYLLLQQGSARPQHLKLQQTHLTTTRRKERNQRRHELPPFVCS